jgi:hypothetical protein
MTRQQIGEGALRLFDFFTLGQEQMGLRLRLEICFGAAARLSAGFRSA